MSKSKTPPLEVTLKRRTPEELQAAVRSYAFAALEKYSKKQSDRAMLRGGEQIPITLTVCGEVGGHWFSEDVEGELQVGHDQTSSSSSGPNLDHLVAYLLEQIPQRKRLRILALLPKHYRAAGELPAAGDESVSAAKLMLAQLRDTVTVPKKGNVRFDPAPPPPPGAGGAALGRAA